MRISLEIPEPDLLVVAEWLDAQQRGKECTSAQHDAITWSTLSRLLVTAAVEHQLERTPSVCAVFQREYDQFNRAQRRAGRLPKSKRTVI